MVFLCARVTYRVPHASLARHLLCHRNILPSRGNFECRSTLFLIVQILLYTFHTTHLESVTSCASPYESLLLHKDLIDLSLFCFDKLHEVLNSLVKYVIHFIVKHALIHIVNRIIIHIVNPEQRQNTIPIIKYLNKQQIHRQLYFFSFLGYLCPLYFKTNRTQMTQFQVFLSLFLLVQKTSSRNVI